MPLFNYSAVDSRGVECSGQLETRDAGQVAAGLRQRGLFPTAVTEVAASRTPAARTNSIRPPRRQWSRLRLNRTASAAELAVFTRQLATLLHAGMPLLRGLEVLARQERNAGFHRVLAALAAAIKAGGTLSEAMAQHPREFDRLYLSMVRAGEAGGALDLVLARVARYQEKSRQLRGRVAAALVYPAIVLAVAANILAGLLVFVVPRFRQIFSDLLRGAPLPALTQIVLATSVWVQSHALAIGIAGALVWLSVGLGRRTARGARWLDALTARLPVLGDLIVKSAAAGFGRTLGTLLTSGVPILPALLITRDTCASTRVSDALADVHDRVKAGAPLASPLEATQVFPPMVTSMIEVGEQTGRLPEMLGQVADIYDDEVDHAVAGLSALIEPTLIVSLAAVVGTIVIALFLPIVRIVQLMT